MSCGSYFHQHVFFILIIHGVPSFLFKYCCCFFLFRWLYFCVQFHKDQIMVFYLHWCLQVAFPIKWWLPATGGWVVGNSAHAPLACSPNRSFSCTCSAQRISDYSKSETCEFCQPFSSVAVKKIKHELNFFSKL